MILLTPLIIFLHLCWNYQKSTKYSHKQFSDYLANENGSIVFLQPTDTGEIANITSSPISNKASGPNNVEISKQLEDLFKLSFMTGDFPWVIKIPKVVPVFKKDSKLNYSNYCLFSLLSNIKKKKLEKLICKRLYTFLNNNIIFKKTLNFMAPFYG